MELCLVDHGADAGSFSEFRAGLDHLEFVVARRNDLDAWAFRLNELGLGHSSVKEPPYTANSMLTFRDPTTSSRSSSVVRPPPDRRYGDWLVYRVAVWVAVQGVRVPPSAPSERAQFNDLCGQWPPC